jgi:predicted Fe-Mo cluster-binding NifX family protein
MKICVTSSDNNLESQIDPRFGRCGYFIIWDDSNNTFEAIANPNIDSSSGAGIQSAQLIVAKEASVVITGKVGPKAEEVLKAANIQIILGENESVKEAIEKYKNNGIDTNSPPQKNTDLETKIGPIKKVINKYFNFNNKLKNGKGNREQGLGQGLGRGRGLGRGQNQGLGLGRGLSQGRGINQNYLCICPKCGKKQPHQMGVPCQSINCIECNSPMIRE